MSRISTLCPRVTQYIAVKPCENSLKIKKVKSSLKPFPGPPCVKLDPPPRIVPITSTAKRSDERNPTLLKAIPICRYGLATNGHITSTWARWAFRPCSLGVNPSAAIRRLPP